MQQEYHELCAKTVHLLLSEAQSKSPVEDHHPEEHIFPNLPTSGAKIGKYTNAEHFKDGLFSEVFRAADPDTKSSHGTPKVVALKITNPSMEQPPHDSNRESRLLTAAAGNHIIPLLETFPQPGGHLVLVFPYMSHDLNTLLHSNRLPPQSRRPILRDLFSGLAHLHQKKILHRDIKPSNLLLPTLTGPLCITDFGTAWSPTDAASEPASEKILDVGTTCYRPPELLFGNAAYTEKLDMWSAGCVAAQILCLNGTTLFDAGDLGSELALIKSMFMTLGTPDLEVWPEAETMPDWGKMNFVKYPGKRWEEILPKAETEGVEFVAGLVRFESRWRMSAEEVCCSFLLGGWKGVMLMFCCLGSWTSVFAVRRLVPR